MEGEEEEEDLLILKPAVMFIELLSFLAELIYNCLVSLLSPIFSLLSLVSESLHRAEEATNRVQSAVHAATKVPSTVAHGSFLLLRKLGLGFLGAAYVCLVLTMVMVVAFIMGVVLVQLWVEEPVFVRESLHFDYTDVNPKAVLSFGGFDGHKKKKKMGVPVGHTFYVSLVLLMPESDYNREIGVFQLTAEAISTNGGVTEKFSQPCMLRFRSLPIRLMRSFMLSIPLLLGISCETQKISIGVLKHKERYPRTEAIRITLSPRAGTSYLPQLYEAEILMNSQLPWTKEVVRNWKWTFYVWTSLYIYIMLLIILICCFKPLIFPMTTASYSDRSERDLSTMEVSKEPQAKAREGREVSESLRRWQRSRSKRKAIILHGVLQETVGSSSASSISVTREDTSVVAEEGVGDSESVCLGG